MTTPPSAPRAATPAGSPHPSLDRFKAELARMSPAERQKAITLLAHIVKQKLEPPGDKS